MLTAGIAVCLVAFALLAVWTGTRPKTRGKLDTKLVLGLVLGTFVGGACTIGTAQLAYTSGLSAWWFCLGGAAGCLVLCAGFAEPFRRMPSPTIVGVLSNRYGSSAGMSATILNSLGTFISILGQIISATSVLAVIAPQMGLAWAVTADVLAMICYVVFGGNAGAGIVGILKLVLIFSTMLACAGIVVALCGGPLEVLGMARDLEKSTGHDFLDLFGRGIGRDLGACASLIVGLVTTQIYAQGIINAVDSASARKGLVISSFTLPVLGGCGILVGLWMRANCPGIAAKTALTQFITMQLPDFVAGVALATLFVSVVGTGAGLALGISSVIRNDVIRPVFGNRTPAFGETTLMRILITAVLCVAAVSCLCISNDTILAYSFLSMALRGAGVVAPLCFALFTNRTASPAGCMAAIFIGPAVVAAFNAAQILPFDPLFVGIAASTAVLFAVSKRVNT